MKLKQLFESEFPSSRKEVEAICKKYKIENYTYNSYLNPHFNPSSNHGPHLH